jgi:hypothetical protein
MSNAITTVTHSDPATQGATQASPAAQPNGSTQKSPQSQPPSTASAPKDTVQISSAAQQALQDWRPKRRP